MAAICFLSEGSGSWQIKAWTLTRSLGKARCQMACVALGSGAWQVEGRERGEGPAGQPCWRPSVEGQFAAERCRRVRPPTWLLNHLTRSAAKEG